MLLTRIMASPRDLLKARERHSGELKGAMSERRRVWQ